MDEFDFIRDLLRPLTGGAASARSLLDDVAVLPDLPGFDTIVTADTLVEGVHFRPEDPLDLTAHKALAVNLSDLAAKGARPLGYLCCVSWPRGGSDADRRAFALGLQRGQERYGLSLWGGDTTSTPGPLTISITMFGACPSGKTPDRRGAKSGDALWVSGPIGDGYLGLALLHGLDLPVAEAERDRVIGAYQVPLARLDVAQTVLVHATASADVSDGLLADAGRIASASGLRVEIDAGSVPLSDAGRLYAHRGGEPGLIQLLTGGDDYQLLVATSSQANLGMAGFHRIGRFTDGSGVGLWREGRDIAPAHLGFVHF